MSKKADENLESKSLERGGCNGRKLVSVEGGDCSKRNIVFPEGTVGVVLRTPRSGQGKRGWPLPEELIFDRIRTGILIKFMDFANRK